MQDDQKNLFIAFALAILVLLGWQWFMPEPAPVKPQPAQTAPAPASVEGAPAIAPSTQGEVPRAEALRQTPRVAIRAPRVSGSISLRGARLDDLTLINYRETIAYDSPRITLLSPSASGHPYFAEFGWLAAGGVRTPDAAAVWSADRTTLTPDQPVTLRWDNGAGQVFRIRLAIDKDFMVTATQSVTNAGARAVTLGGYGLLSRTNPPHDKSGSYVIHEGPLGVFETLKEVGYKALREDEPSQSFAGTGGWLGIADKYWLAALVPQQNQPISAQFRYLGDERFQTDFHYPLKVLAPGGTATVTTRLFAGAKEVGLIDRYEKQHGIALFDRAIDWGWFYFLTRPLFFLLDWLYRLVGNFGVAIIGLTVIVRLVLFPLANKQFASMNKMKLVQPRFKEIQERFKDDKAAQQKALMELYSKEKINPLAGCLPILLQMPIFFALFKVFSVTIEMRHQPFALWIRDLSAPDPLTPVNLFGLLPFTPPSMIAIGILPLIMGVTMWAQMKLSPTPMTDPVQQKIFAWFPVVFTVMLAPFAAGLVLYWTVNNILSIAQQWLLAKRHPAPKHDPKPA